MDMPNEPKGKKAKAPKGKKQKEKKIKEKKPLSAGLVGLIVAMVFIFLICGFYAALQFNLLGLKDTVAVSMLGPEGRSPTQKELDALFEERAALQKDKEEIENKENELKEIQASLDKRSEQVEKAEKDLEAKQQASLQQETETVDEETSMQGLSKIYAKMDPASAAEALSAMQDTNDIVAIMQSLNPAQAAKILESMEPSLASSITLAMMP